MRDASLTEYLKLGTGLRYLIDARAGESLGGKYILSNITTVLALIRDLGFQQTAQSAGYRQLENLSTELAAAGTENTKINERQAAKLGEAARKVRTSLFTEAEGRQVYVGSVGQHGADRADNSDKPAPEPADVQVARISARQAIIVAAITALAGTSGLIGAAVQRTTAPPPSVPAQAWLQIDGVEFNVPQPGLKVRITAFVNGISYSFPSQALWSAVGREMAPHALPLPLGDSAYTLSFGLIYADGDGTDVRYAQSSSTVRVRAGQIPIDSDYKLFNVDAGTRTQAIATIRYKVTHEP